MSYVLYFWRQTTRRTTYVTNRLNRSSDRNEMKDIIDYILILPFVPLVPVAVLWWLPWGKIIDWKRIPKAFIIPYLLYGAVAAWHFHHEGWSCVIAAVGTGYCFAAILADVKKTEGAAKGTPTSEKQAEPEEPTKVQEKTSI